MGRNIWELIFLPLYLFASQEAGSATVSVAVRGVSRRTFAQKCVWRDARAPNAFFCRPESRGRECYRFVTGLLPFLLPAKSLTIPESFRDYRVTPFSE